jgi:hypothetical protein
MTDDEISELESNIASVLISFETQREFASAEIAWKLLGELRATRRKLDSCRMVWAGGI